jgi:hypothetical protein
VCGVLISAVLVTWGACAAWAAQPSWFAYNKIDDTCHEMPPPEKVMAIYAGQGRYPLVTARGPTAPSHPGGTDGVQINIQTTIPTGEHRFMALYSDKGACERDGPDQP